MKIKDKLVLAFTLPIILICLLCLVVFTVNRSLYIKSAEISEMKVKAVVTMEALDNELSRYTLAYLMQNEQATRQHFDEVVSKQTQQLDSYKKFPLTNEEKQYFREMEQAVNETIKIEKALFQVADQITQSIKLLNELLGKNIEPLLNEWQNNLKTSDAGSQAKQIALNRLELNIHQAVSIAREYMLSVEPALKEQAQANIKNTTQSLNELAKLNLNSQEIIWSNQLNDFTNKLTLAINDNIQLAEKRTALMQQDEQVSTRIDHIVDEKLYVSAHDQAKSIQDLIITINYTISVILMCFILLGILLARLFAGYLMRPIEALRASIARLRAGEDVEVKRISNDEIGDLSDAFSELVQQNKAHAAAMSEQNWLKEHVAEILKTAQAETNLQNMCNTVINKLATLIGAGCGAFYITQEDETKVKTLFLLGTYGYQQRKTVSNQFKFGEALVGQAALEGKYILLTDVPEDYIHITSGLGDKKPAYIIVLPIILENRTLAVIELALFHRLTDIQQQFLDQLSNNLAVVIEAIQSRQQTEFALQQVQEASVELQAQQEELRASNEELEEKTQILQQSEEELKTQSEELRGANEELEEKMHAIEQQNREIENKNRELEEIRHELEVKARALTRAGKYKTEFLSNMSHELRTPLNSLLLLSKSFASNEDGNLTKEQIEQANIIYKGGKDLLELINDILDLSKVEAGKLNIQIEEANISDITEDLKRQFDSVAKDKQLKFEVEPKVSFDTITTDAHRLKQILRNLISNAIKFTKEGYVKLVISKPEKDVKLTNKNINLDQCIVFEVIDTGVGIEKEKFQDIFEAFQQAYGNTDRVYGGTGLGLTISRELAKLLGGEILLESTIGKGSKFSLVIPIASNGALENSGPQSESVETSETHNLAVLPEDEVPVAKDDKIILLIGAEQEFIETLVQITKKKGYQCITAVDGATGLALAKTHQPAGIILSLALPDMEGVQVLQQLKEQSSTKAIPVHIISDKDASSLPAPFQSTHLLKKPIKVEELNNIFEYFANNVLQPNIRVLLVEDDLVTQKAICHAVAGKNIAITAVATGKEAINQLESAVFDGIILDLKLPDMDGSELLKVAKEKFAALPPVIIHSVKDLSEAEFAELNQYTNKIVRKEGHTSLERLLNECSLFLHAVKQKSPPAKNNPKMISETDTILRDKEVLLVDDDMRNVYALSTVLQRRNMKVTIATNGEEALKKIAQMRQVDIVIMDIMMPVMDGYETMKRIRQQKQYQNLPIIAVTAKAMPEDKKACIEAGANDYITKPLDDEKLFSMMRIWLSCAER